ncbi:type IVB secretion system protein IcmH/DotU [Pseudomonas tolaasii]|uniref:type IVB secretion system protein IcmH/DotU n=1 Tax=Pseudomonas tolaasii TaxID=29442 RepID=UPI0002E69BB1|nr:type IVB secretion system protein IcmH/DotU [Pseudomonas tolaasii]
MDSEYPQDEKTILLDSEGRGPFQVPITDFPSAPRFEQLEGRMVYAARAQDVHRFKTSTNSLVVAAWPLLLQVVELKSSSGRDSIAAVNDRLSSAVNQFEACALQSGVEGSEVISARYVLCSVIDEAVVTTEWGNHSDWSRMSLLSRFHNETFGGEKVFQLLERLCRDPIRHLAMLELIYLCLAIGFEGKYRVLERGACELEAVRDALHRQIRQVRGDPPNDPAPPLTGRRKRFRVISARWIAAFALACGVSLYIGFAWKLGELRGHALQPFLSSAPEPIQTPS